VAFERSEKAKRNNAVADVADVALSVGVKPTRADDDLSIPTFLDRRGVLKRPPCAQCNADDGQQIQFGEVWLHKECKPFHFGER
jgi:hypothetical protein